MLLGKRRQTPRPCLTISGWVAYALQIEDHNLIGPDNGVYRSDYPRQVLICNREFDFGSGNQIEDEGLTAIESRPLDSATTGMVYLRDVEFRYFELCSELLKRVEGTLVKN